MIVQSLCNTCFQPFRIVIQTEEAALVKELLDSDGLAACPRLCGGKINLNRDPTIAKMSKDRRLRDSLQITGMELYQAVFGMGLPDEIPKSREAVEALLLAHRIKGVDIEVVDGRLYLHEIHLGGVVLHLAAGARGAHVLKLTKEK